MALRVDDVMMEIMEKLHYITEHFQKHSFINSSNKIAKSTNDIVTVFTDAVIKFTPDQMIIANNQGNLVQKTENGVNDHERNMALEEANDNNANSVNGSHPESTLMMSPFPVRQHTTTWAKVAEAGTNSGGVVYPTKILRADKTPSVTMVQQEQQQQQAIPPNPVNRPMLDLNLEIEDAKAGSLTVAGNFPKGSLSVLTSKIREGPLFSVEIMHGDGYAEVVFQMASHALAFVENDREMIARTGFGRFGRGYSVICMAEFDWNEDIRKMAQMPRERRRLTFARAGLLGTSLTFKRFQAEITAVAGGADAIELVWAFNSGNITAVFKSVAVAKVVRDHFLSKSTQPGPYTGVQVTFSTDPCERPLFLGTQVGPQSIVRRKNHQRASLMQK